MEDRMSYRSGAKTYFSADGRFVLAAAAASMLAFRAMGGPPQTSTSKTEIETITVEAARERARVVQQVNQFVSAIVVKRSDQSLANWEREIPICPLVAGLPRSDGEYMLSRLSQIAASAGAPLAPQHCKPNLYVVVTSEPDALLKAWNMRDVNLFDSGDDHGGGEIRQFLDAKLPIRAWYNAEIYDADGKPLRESGGAGCGLDAASAGALNGLRMNCSASATRIRFNDVRNLSSVIVLVDATSAKGVSFGQLAAYVGMVGLAEIKISPAVSSTPSILQLFSDIVPAPTGLTEWDEAFLKGLYHTDHLDQHQILGVKTSMVDDLASNH
jgi:hypothetical protein